MCIERYVRLVAGSLVLVSLALGYFASPWFFALTVFVGGNLFQAALSNWCLLESVLRAFGVPECRAPSRPSPKQGETLTESRVS